MMEFKPCQSCGQNIPSTNKYCPYCGAKQVSRVKIKRRITNKSRHAKNLFLAPWNLYKNFATAGHRIWGLGIICLFYFFNKYCITSISVSTIISPHYHYLPILDSYGGEVFLSLVLLFLESRLFLKHADWRIGIGLLVAVSGTALVFKIYYWYIKLIVDGELMQTIKDLGQFAIVIGVVAVIFIYASDEENVYDHTSHYTGHHYNRHPIYQYGISDDYYYYGDDGKSHSVNPDDIY